MTSYRPCGTEVGHTIKLRRTETSRRSAGHPAVCLVGVGVTGNRLLDALHRGDGEADVTPLVTVATSSDGASDAVTVNGSQTAGGLKEFDGADLVVILASAEEPDGLRLSGVVARAAHAAGTQVFAMLAQPPFPPGVSVRTVAAEIADCIDALIFIPSDPHTSMAQHVLAAYVAAAVGGISGDVQLRAPVGADFLDVRRTFIGAGEAFTGVGLATGTDRARRAAKVALAEIGPTRLAMATGVLILVAGARSLRLREIAAATYAVHEAASHDSRVALAVHYDERLGEAVRVTLIVAERATCASGC